MNIVYTAGVWDLIHHGHLNFLRESAKLGEILVVGVVSDEGTRNYKGIYPVDAEYQRLETIARLPWVTLAVPQLGTDPSLNLRRFMPDIFTHGDDWDRLKEGHETLEELGIEYRTIPYTQGISSTMLRRYDGTS
jgi:cytidyltransferase-like protein